MRWSVLTVFVWSVCVVSSIRTDPGHHFYSQAGQDAFVYTRFFKDITQGIFVDIGAHDGITYNNTYFFEKQCGWQGLCVEPLPEVFQQLCHNRSCWCVQGCIYDKTGTVPFLQVISTTLEHTEMLSGIVALYDQRHLQRIASETSNGAGESKEIMVRCYALNELLEFYNLYHVNYLSIDTEGGELAILQSIDFKRFTIDVIDVENNYHDPAFAQFLAMQGYIKVHEIPYCGDEIYVRSALYAQSL